MKSAALTKITLAVSALLLVTACDDPTNFFSGVNPRYQLHKQDRGNPLLLDTKTGQVFEIRDGMVMPLERWTRKDLDLKTFDLERISQTQLNFFMKAKFRNGRLQFIANFRPHMVPMETEDKNVMQELVPADPNWKNEFTQKGRISSITIEFKDLSGFNVGKSVLSLTKYSSRNVDENGEVVGYTFIGSTRMSEADYASVKTIDDLWVKRIKPDKDKK